MESQDHSLLLGLPFFAGNRWIGFPSRLFKQHSWTWNTNCEFSQHTKHVLACCRLLRRQNGGSIKWAWRRVWHVRYSFRWGSATRTERLLQLANLSPALCKGETSWRPWHHQRIGGGRFTDRRAVCMRPTQIASLTLKSGAVQRSALHGWTVQGTEWRCMVAYVVATHQGIRELRPHWAATINIIQNISKYYANIIQPPSTLMKHSFETHSHTMFCEKCLRVDLTIFFQRGTWAWPLAHIGACGPKRSVACQGPTKPCVIWAPWQIRL